MYRICTFAVLIAIPCGVLHAETDWPSKPVTIIIPSPPGGSSDISVRNFSQPLSEKLKQQFGIESVPGGGGNIANLKIVQSSPDGYTCGMISAATHGVASSLYSKMQYDPVEDFSFVARFVTIPNVILVPKDSKYRTLEELIDDAKANPDKLTYGSLGQGTTTHLTGVALTEQANIRSLHVPYKGSGPIQIALQSGEIDYAFDQLTGSIGQIMSGELRPLALAAPQRVPQFPDVPVVSESGIGDFEFSTWYGIACPKGVAPEIIDKFSSEVSEILSRPEVISNYQRFGAQPDFLPKSDFRNFVEQEISKWAPIVNSIGLKIE